MVFQVLGHKRASKGPTPEAKPIYCVVAIGFRDKKASTGLRHRAWGWYPSMNEARRAIRDCSDFIHENNYYPWCLIEQVPPGMCSNTQALEWYRLKGGLKPDGWYVGRYARTRCPQWAKRICNWSLG